MRNRSTSVRCARTCAARARRRRSSLPRTCRARCAGRKKGTGGGGGSGKRRCVWASRTGIIIVIIIYVYARFAFRLCVWRYPMIYTVTKRAGQNTYTVLVFEKQTNYWSSPGHTCTSPLSEHASHFSLYFHLSCQPWRFALLEQAHS